MKISCQIVQDDYQVILPVERLNLKGGTDKSQRYSHYEEDDLMSSKMKNSSRIVLEEKLHFGTQTKKPSALW